MNKIYTKRGDRGMTGTFVGRISKSDQLAVALGSIDELNSWIGVCRSELGVKSYELRFVGKELRRIQKNLLTLGSGMAGSSLKFLGYETTRLEKLIDKLTGDLPKLGNFIYPTGVEGAAVLQVARTVARRAEREVVASGQATRAVLKYLNRLSDALFTMARWVNFKNGGEEEIWKG